MELNFNLLEEKNCDYALECNEHHSMQTLKENQNLLHLPSMPPAIKMSRSGSA